MAAPNVSGDSVRDDCLRATTLEGCVRGVVDEAIRSPKHRVDSFLVFQDVEAIRTCLRALCALAHGRDIRVERLIVMLKHTAQTMPAAQSIVRASGGERLVAQLVALLIDEFYHSRERHD